MANKEKAHYWARIIPTALLWLLGKADKKEEVIDKLYDNQLCTINYALITVETAKTVNKK